MSSRCWPRRGTASEDGMTWTFNLASGREVPRRHRLQRQGGLLQLRPLVQLQRRPAEPGQLVLLAGSVSAASRPRGLRLSAGDEPLQVLRGHATTTTAVITLHVAVVGVPRRRSCCRRSRSPARPRWTQYGADERSTGDSVEVRRHVRHRAPDRHRPVQVRVAGPPATSWSLERNDDYWGTKAAPQDGHLPGASRTARRRRQALETGEIDGYDLVVAADVDGLKGGFQVLPGRRSTSATSASTRTRRRSTTSRSARRSRTRSTVRRVVKAKYPTGAEVAKEFMPPSLLGYSKDVPEYSYDPDKAKAAAQPSPVSRTRRSSSGTRPT